MCKTCSDYNHTCLGYDDPPSHVRSQSDSSSRRPTFRVGHASKDATNPERSRAVESVSPDPPSRATGPSHGHNVKLPDMATPPEARNTSSQNSSARATKDPEQQDGDSPGSSKYQMGLILFPNMYQPSTVLLLGPLETMLTMSGFLV